jgi:exodeoxyribonuclease-3
VLIATWNVNSVSARLPRLLGWLEQRSPDVVALQETKCANDAFPFAELAARGYQAMPVGDGRWNGVAILSRVGLEPLSATLAQYPEARYAAARCDTLTVTSVYVPNGRSLDDPHYAYKLAWLAELRKSLDAHDPSEPLVIMGDFNVAPNDDDVWDMAAFQGATHVTSAERHGVGALLDWGLTDVKARPGKGDRAFTYWDYRAGMFHKDLGMRIDLVLASRSVHPVDAYVDREARKGKLPSDHAPIVLEVEIKAG